MYSPEVGNLFIANLKSFATESFTFFFLRQFFLHDFSSSSSSSSPVLLWPRPSSRVCVWVSLWYNRAAIKFSYFLFVRRVSVRSRECIGLCVRWKSMKIFFFSARFFFLACNLSISSIDSIHRVQTYHNNHVNTTYGNITGCLASRSDCVHAVSVGVGDGGSHWRAQENDTTHF